ncbi:MAG: invasion associated locus B family protein [bacterium]
MMIFSAPATAQQGEAREVAVYRDWKVHKRDLGGDTVCYALTEASDKSPRSANHGNVFFMVSTWRSGVAKNQPSFMAGYDLRNAPEPTIRIGADKWGLYTDGNEAFIDKTRDEERLISAMRRGSDMRVSAVSARGTATNYSFSLLGISAALDRVKKECG